MAMTTVSLKQKMEQVRELEADVKYYKAQKDLYELHYQNGIVQDERGMNVETLMRRYRNAYEYSIERLRLYKLELDKICNMEAFGYDSPILLDESWYEKQFKQNGYFIGIRL